MEDRVKNVSISNETMIRFVLIILLFVAGFWVRDLVLIILTSVVIASFVESAVLRLRKWKFPRALTVSIVYIIFLGAIFGIFYFLAPIIVNEFSSLVSSLEAYIPRSGFLGSISGLSGQSSDVSNLIGNIADSGSFPSIIGDTANIIGSGSGNFVQSLSHIFGSLLNVVLIVIISFYLSLQEKGIEAFLRIVTPRRHELYVIDLWQRTERKIGLWMQSQLILGLIVGVLVYVGLTVLGVPYAFLIALITAFFELIPFGILIAIIPAVLLSYLGGGIVLLFKTLGLFIVVSQIENYVLAPLIVRKVVGISPIVMILSVLIGAKLASFWGVILAIPVAVFLFEYINDREKRKDTDITI